jgi:hypothetical protein
VGIPTIDSVEHLPDSVYAIYFSWSSEYNAAPALMTRMLLSEDGTTSKFTAEYPQRIKTLSPGHYQALVTRYDYNGPKEAAVIAYNKSAGTMYGGTDYQSQTPLSNVVRLW